MNQLFTCVLVYLSFLLVFSCTIRKKEITANQEKTTEMIEAETISENDLEEIPIAPPPPPPSETEKIFKVAENMPRFPGCENPVEPAADRQACANEKLNDYIYANIKYPEEAKANGIEGTCVLSFMVTKTGTLKDIKVIRDIGGGCGAEAVRIVNSMNENGILWIPGKQRGNPVNVRFNLSVRFKLPGQ